MRIKNDYEEKCIQYLELLNSIEELEISEDLSLDFQKEIGKRLKQFEKEILAQPLRKNSFN